MIQSLTDAFIALQAWLFDALVQPVMFALGLGSFVELGFDGVEFVLLGLLELAVAYLLLRPLEALWPAERWAARRAVRVDMLYTFLNRLGIVPLAVFLLLAPLFAEVESWLRFHDLLPRQLEDLLPALDHHPLVSFLLYLVILDFAEYWRHRLSHVFRWWWALHGIHHSQRQMSFWTDSRNHLADDLIAGLWFAGLALFIGVPPGHFIGLLIALRLVENLSHANTRFDFGPIGDYLVVGPLYHRWHHALETHFHVAGEAQGKQHRLDEGVEQPALDRNEQVGQKLHHRFGMVAKQKPRSLSPAISGSSMGAKGSLRDQMPRWAIRMSPSRMLARARLSRASLG